jgi:hypothetical protein
MLCESLKQSLFRTNPKLACIVLKKTSFLFLSIFPGEFKYKLLILTNNQNIEMFSFGFAFP